MTDTLPAERPSLLRRVGRTLRGFILWSHPRGSWQYDVMVALILLFVLLTPTRFFHDQPVYRPTLISDIVRLEAGAEGVRYRVSAELLLSYDNDPRRAAEAVLALNLSHPVSITRIQPIREPQGAVVWYDVWVRE